MQTLNFAQVLTHSKMFKNLLNIRDYVRSFWLQYKFFIFINTNSFNPLTTNVPHHIETSQLICNANQLTGSYMIGNVGH